MVLRAETSNGSAPSAHTSNTAKNLSFFPSLPTIDQSCFCSCFILPVGSPSSFASNGMPVGGVGDVVTFADALAAEVTNGRPQHKHESPVIHRWTPLSHFNKSFKTIEEGWSECTSEKTATHTVLEQQPRVWCTLQTREEQTITTTIGHGTQTAPREK